MPDIKTALKCLGGSSESVSTATSLAVFQKIASLKANPSVVSCFLFNNKVISLGTGTKSFPGNGVLRDCHAEVLARRGFLLYLLKNIDNPDVIKDGKLVHKLVFYTSKVPCGDCSTTILNRSQSKLEHIENLAKIEIWKNLNANADDNELVLRGRLDYDKLGVLRTKPGRIDSANSNLMSCSDKIAKWICIGVGGALVNLLLEPIYISTIVIGGADWDEHSIRRGLLGRTFKWRKSQDILDFEPQILHSDLQIPWDWSQKCHESMIWIEGEGLEVLVKGRKRGFGPRKGVWNEKANSVVSKRNLKKEFLEKSKNLMLKKDHPADYEQMTYRLLKKLAVDYQSRKANLYNSTFKGWIRACASLDEF